jgi:hypothetical protein
MSPEEYAAHKDIQIQNPNQRGGKGTAMGKPSREELEARINELEEENQVLNEKLDCITEIAATDEDGEDGEDDDVTN